MFARKIPACHNCGTKTKLSMRQLCNICEWACSRRFDLDGQRLENEMKGSEIKHLNSCLTTCQDTSRQAKEAAHLEQLILVEENVKLRSTLIKAHRQLIKLRSVK